MTRLEMIRAKRAELNKEEENKQNAVNALNEKAIAKIKTFADDFKELREIANEMIEQGFKLGTEMYLEPTPSFITNWWSHDIGFYPTEYPTSYSQHYTIKGFGVINGGAYGEVNLLINFDGDILSYGKVHSDGKMVDIIRFAKHFPTFKEKFLAYVDKKFC